MRAAAPATTATPPSTCRIASWRPILYTLPFGKGQRFLNHGGIVNQVVGGWQVSTITTLQSGLPIDTTSWDSAGVVFIPNSNRTNCVAGVTRCSPNPTANG